MCAQKHLDSAGVRERGVLGARRFLAQRERISVSMPRAAAILVAIVDDGEEPGVILTRRAATLRSHAGEVAFPGGRIDERDEGPMAAALREAREEIGLVPDEVEVIGLLDDILRHTTSVTPVLARVARRAPLAPAREEVARVFEVPLSALRKRDAWSIPRYVTRLGLEWPVFTFKWDGEVIWGLTAYVLLLMLEAVGDAPLRLPPPYSR